MKTLRKEQVLRLHNALLETFGGTAGIRDDGLLESALNAPFATFGGQYLYPSIQAKAAQLGFGLPVRSVLRARSDLMGFLTGRTSTVPCWQPVVSVCAISLPTRPRRLLTVA